MFRLTEKEKEKALRLLYGMLSVPSVNGQFREADIAEYLKDYFADTEYCTYLEKIDEKRSNFILDVPGKEKGKHVVWNGHMDTVPYGDLCAWTSDPAVPVIRGGKIYGRGTSDMKSGLCAMAFAIRYLWEHGLTAQETIRFVGTCDEEKGGTGAEMFLRDGFFGKPDFLLIGEPTDCNVGIAQKGCIWLELQVKGKTCHGAYPWMGVNSVELGFELCRQIKTFVLSYQHPVLSRATAEVTCAEGGVANNMIPDEASFVMDIRSVPGLSHERLLHECRVLAEAMEARTPGFEVAFHVMNERRSVELSPEHERVNRLHEGIAKVTGKNADNIGISFFTDASVLLRKQKVPTLLFGPGNPALCHKPDEYVELEKFYQSIEVFIYLAISDAYENGRPDVYDA